MNSVVHFKTHAKETKKASNLYGKAFDWNSNQFPGFEYFEYLLRR